MSATVTMTHPDLPGQDITVHQESVAHYQASGWQVADEATASRPAATRRPRTTKGTD